MRIQTFTASSMKDAMTQVRDALGDEAIILSSQENGSVVHVRAAVEVGSSAQKDAAPLIDLDIERKLQEELRKRVETLGGANEASKPEAVSPPITAARLAELLKFHGISASLALALRRVALAVEVEQGEIALAGALDSRLSFSPLPARPSKPVVVVGTPGVGKTSVVAKLMARAALADISVRVMTADTARSGALEQLQASAAITNTKVLKVESPEALEKHLETSGEGDFLTLIDTQGVNPFDTNDMSALNDIVAASGGEPVMIASAGADGAELSDTACAFKQCGAQRIIVTRLDASRRLGGILVAADAAGMKLSHVSQSPYVAEGLQAVNPMLFSKFLLSPPKSLPSAAKAVAEDGKLQSHG